MPRIMPDDCSIQASDSPGARWWSCLARLANWPFALKMAFCPALALGALLGLGLYAVVAADHQANLIRAVVHQDLAAAAQLSESAASLKDVTGALYRLAALRAIGATDVDLSAQVTVLTERTSAVSEELQRLADRIVPGGDRDQLLWLAADVRRQHVAGELFGTMLEMDLPSAVGFFHQFDNDTGRVLAQINAITAHAFREASRRAETSARLAERLHFVVVLVAVTGAVVQFGVAMVLTKWTVVSVKQIASATEQVAKGGVEVDVGALARGDELGTIVRSLAVFQSNIAQIAFLAHHDPLTRLPNRILFHTRVQQALARVDRGSRFAVLCLDLDRFKAVNDTLGHLVGDDLLRQVADRLRACVREGDVVARLGGDEFALVLLDISEPSEINALAIHIVEMIGASYEIGGHQINIGASIGVAIAPGNGTTSHDLLKNADTALYGAKANGRGMACFYEASMNEALQLRRALEMGLRQAVIREEFQLHYQPLVDAHSRCIVGFEALLRWPYAEPGMHQPGEFIPIAEACGLIGEIGRWVLRRACQDAASWPGDLRVSVNLSPLQFKGRDLVDDIRAALADSGLPAGRLELEITESALLQDSDAVMAVLGEIKKVGALVSMDDFGTGYSSLSYLQTFPFDRVKIDRSFVKDLLHDRNSAAIVRAIVGLSGALGIAVTAEGVETEEQAAELASGHCTSLQGYLFSRPVPKQDVSDLIERLSKRVLAEQNA